MIRIVGRPRTSNSEAGSRPRRRFVPRLDALEGRLAPATLVSPTTVAYTEVDGDRVTVTTSRGTFADPQTSADDFAFVPAGMGEQLQLIDLSNDGTEFAGASLTILARRTAAGGDGHANVGYLNAGGIDLGRVTVDGDLGRVDTGDGTAATPGLAGLTVQSLGRFGTSTQGPNPSLGSTVHGRLGSLVVRSDVVEARVLVTGGAAGTVGPVTVGGSVVGGPDTASGSITSQGAMGPVRIGGDLRGGAGESSGSIRTGGALAGLTIRGSLDGGAGLESGAVVSGGALGPVKIGGSLRGGPGESSGTIWAEGALAGLTVGGSLVGGTGNSGGTGACRGDMGPVRIGGDVLGGPGVFSGFISPQGALAGLTVRGSVRGGDGVGSGWITSGLDMGPVRIGGDLQGGAGVNSGLVMAARSLAGVTIGGSVLGGNQSSTGTVYSGANLGPVRIGGDLVGGNATGTASLDDSGHIEGQRIASVFIGGSIIGGRDESTSVLLDSGSIRARDDLGPVTVKGSLVGNDTHRVRIVARGQAAPGPTGDVAIARVTVGGRVEYADILAGYGDLAGFAGVGPRNADASVGPVTVGGDWVAASLAAGAGPGADQSYGTPDDVRLSGAQVKDDPGVIAGIARITIRGQALGTVGGADHYGIVAEQVGALAVGDTAIPLTAGRDDAAVGATGDLRVREV